MKIAVSKHALQEFIRRALSETGFIPKMKTDPSSVVISAVVDPSAALTDPSNPNFKPKTKMELNPAMSTIIDDMADDDVPKFYDTLKDVIQGMKAKDKKMKKDDKKIEALVRAAVRKTLKEVGPYRDTGISYSGPVSGSSSRSEFDECEECEGEGHLADGSKCKACKGEGEVPSQGKRSYNLADVEAGEATFDEIAKELEFANPMGARQAVEKALTKVKFLSDMDPDDLQIVTLTAMSDYIDFLNSSGELTSADVQLLKDHPEIVTQLDGFREYLRKYVNREMRKSGAAVE